MTFISEDVTTELNTYSFAERCEALADLAESPSTDSEFEEFFDYSDESMELASLVTNQQYIPDVEEIEIINNQFRHYILLLNGWHR